MSPGVAIPELIRAKRDGRELSAAELQQLLTGYLQGEVKDYQMAAWLMAVFFRGLSPAETETWTRLMWRSGVTFPRGADEFRVDKHSTGGVGDKTSLLLVPLVNAAATRLFGPRVKIPMVSGRGLGHSGGTLDKLESVPGFSPAISIERAVALLREHGFFMMGQTAELAPADRQLYALRDVTGTVECIPLIVSSILSKKLAENLDGLVLDVKTGAGAFMKTREDARLLARTLCAVARRNGVATLALITRMDEPLGYAVGNQLEVEECEDFLSGARREAGLREVTVALGGQMLALAGGGRLSAADARAEIEHELTQLESLRIYRRMFEAQGGSWDAYKRQREQLHAECPREEIRAERDGHVQSIDAMKIALLVVALGGGRARKEDTIDPWVGVELTKHSGDAVRAGETIARVFYRNEEQRELIARSWAGAVVIGEKALPKRPWVEEVVE